MSDPRDSVSASDQAPQRGVDTAAVRRAVASWDRDVFRLAGLLCDEVDRLRAEREQMHEWIAGIPARIATNEWLDERTADFATGVVEGILGRWFGEGPVAELLRQQGGQG